MKLCVAVVLLTLGCAAPAARASEFTQRDRAGDVRGATRLGQRERAALDIAKVTAHSDAAGLAVDVRLRGDFERLAGSGALKGAAAEIVLHRTRGRSGVLSTSGPDRRARMRSAHLDKGALVVRDGRVLRFRVLGDISTVTSVRVRVSAARKASDTADVAVLHPPALAGPCDDYAGRRSEVEGRLGAVYRRLAGKRTASRRKRLLQERNRLEDYLFRLGTKIVFGCPDLPASSGPIGPGGKVLNRPPVARFVVDPAGPGYKAGQTLTFRATGSEDPDGTIKTYVWSDGSPPHPIETGEQMSRWYGAPGIYKVTLSVADDRGGTAFASRTLFVGGQGTRTLRNPDNSKVTITCPAPGSSPVGGAVEILVPSYAEDPFATTPNPCPDASLSTTVSHVAGNTQGETDAWGRPDDTMRIAFQLQQVGPGVGGQSVPLDWSAGWK